jgi:hypothetical protein
MKPGLKLQQHYPVGRDPHEMRQLQPRVAGHEPLLYPIWQPLPRPRFFPKNPKLDRLLDSNFDLGVRQFKLSLWRREARDLRKGLFSPKGIRKDTPKGYGVRTFDLPKGWRLRLTYDAPPDSWSEPGDVVAEFIPPAMRKRGPVSTLRAELLAAVAPQGAG